MGKSRGKFAAEQKAAILREHLIEKVPVADSCGKDGLQPGLFPVLSLRLKEGAVSASIP